MYFVYLTTNLENGKQYVGSHTGKETDGYLGSGILISKALNKYGVNSFKRKILKLTKTRKEAFDLEEIYINEYNTLKPNCYNLSPTGGMNEWGGKHSDETKKLLSEKRKGKAPWNKGKTGLYKHSEKTKSKLSKLNSGKNNKMFGRKKEKCPSFGLKRSKDTKIKMSQTKIGGQNPNAKKYFIKTPDNKEFTVNSATEFVNKYPEYNINRHFIYTASNKEGYHKEWFIKKI